MLCLHVFWWFHVLNALSIEHEVGIAYGCSSYSWWSLGSRSRSRAARSALARVALLLHVGRQVEREARVARERDHRQVVLPRAWSPLVWSAPYMSTTVVMLVLFGWM